MAYDPSIFNISPYYDDYSRDNRFLRILFKPGYAVQARELTQMQSILQDQISRVGDNLFKDGSRVVGAPITVRNTNFLGLNTGAGTPFAAFGASDWNGLLGGVVYYGATASGTIAHVLPPETDDKLFVVVDYSLGYGTAIPSTGVTVGITTSASAAYLPFVPAGATYNGLCKLVTVGNGIFYVDGMFVVNTQQSFAPYSVSGSQRSLTGTVDGVTFAGLDKKVGFAITRDTTTSVENTSLLDPSFGSPNYRAPGADRYMLNLTLAQTDLTEITDNFIEMVRFEDGKVTKKIDKVIYGDIAKTLAQRTYDESGSYVVKPFEVSVRETSPVSENLNVVIGPGKAYVFGNEVETKYPTIIGISKGRSSQSVASQSFSFKTGNVVVVGLSTDGVAIANSGGGSSAGATAYANLATLNGGSSIVQFRNGVTGSVIGSGNLHGFIPKFSGRTGYQFAAYLYGMSAGSVIAGACTMHVYDGASAGSTFGTFFSSGGLAAGFLSTSLGASAAEDTCLVYEVTPTQGVSGFTAVSFYGKAATKSSVLNAPAVSYTTTNTTYTVAPADLDLPSSLASYVSLVADYAQPTSSRLELNKFHIVNSQGLALSVGGVDGSSSVTSTVAAIYSSGSSVVIGISSGFAQTGMTLTGFTGTSGLPSAIKVIVPYKYTPNLATPNGVSASCRTKTSVEKTHTAGSITLQTINGRIGITLPNWDVYSVSSILTGSGASPTTSALTDFELDDGQREGFYDFSALLVKKSKEGITIPGTSTTYTAGNATFLTTTYKYLLHGGTKFGPFVGSQSYIAGFSYDQIPLFTNPRTGRTVSLANCIDFRHSGPTGDGFVNSKPYGDYEGMSVTTAAWDNYLPRLDRLSLKINPSDSSVSFAIDKGFSELSPQSPPETENSVTLATLLVPAYTQRATDVVVTKNDVRRYTMSDIHEVEKRIDNMEVFTKLSLSEAEMANQTIKAYVDQYLLIGGTTAALGVTAGLNYEPIKTSIYADDFYGHAGADVADTDHRCSVDYENGEIRSLFLHNPLTLGSLPTISAGATLSNDGLLTLDYTATRHVSNTGYNKSITANATGTVNWLGFTKITKQYETSFETGVRPVVYNNNMLENDNWLGSNANDTRGYGTQWNDWESLWSGISLRVDANDDIQKRILNTPKINSLSSIPTVNSGNEKIGINRNTTPTNQRVGNLLNTSRLLGRTRYRTPDNKIVDRTVVPFIPVSTVGVTAYGLRPNSSGLNLYVDGGLVKSGASTDSNGTVGITFSFASGSYLSGEKSIRISDASDSQLATQAADGVFYCGGIIQQRSDGVYSTRNADYRRQTVTSEGIIKDPFKREVSYDNIQSTVGNNQWTDPLCQTFFVDAKQNPEGIFVKSVTLYFDGADTKLPVTVQLRPTISGYPSPSVSFPFSTVTLLPSQVSTGLVGSTTTPVGTGFTFSSPVYLEPGEYAIAVLTNSKNYTLRANDSGVNLTNDGRSNSPLVGTMYVSQSVGAATQDLSTDIAFSVDRCEFSTAYSSGTYQTTSAALDVGNCQVIKIATPQILPIGCTVTTLLDPTSTLVRIDNNQNTYLSSAFTASKDLRYTLSRPTQTYLSPAVDTGVFFGMGVEMICTPNTSAAAPTSSYVSKAVSLPDELASIGVFTTSEVCCPYGSEVRAYVRWSEKGDGELFGRPWAAMTAISGLGSPKHPFTASGGLSSTEYDFRTTKWIWFNGVGAGSALNSTATIRAYQIKLVFTVTSGVQAALATKTYSILPSVRNLRMASFR